MTFDLSTDGELRDVSLRLISALRSAGMTEENVRFALQHSFLTACWVKDSPRSVFLRFWVFLDRLYGLRRRRIADLREQPITADDETFLRTLYFVGLTLDRARMISMRPRLARRWVKRMPRETVIDYGAQP